MAFEGAKDQVCLWHISSTPIQCQWVVMHHNTWDSKNLFGQPSMSYSNNKLHAFENKLEQCGTSNCIKGAQAREIFPTFKL